MTPHEFLGLLDDAIAQAPSGRKAIALELYVRGGVVLPKGAPHIKGKYLGADERGSLYGFTRRQCEEMREVILAAAREDAGIAHG